MRDQTTIIVALFDHDICAHFTSPKKLQGSDYDLWFPLSKAKSVDEIDFSEIERLMQINHIAHNCTSIQQVNGQKGKFAEYRIVYNQWVHPDEIKRQQSEARAKADAQVAA